jgi:hypothetical protein
VFQLFIALLTCALAISGAAAPWLTLTYCQPKVLSVPERCVSTTYYLSGTSSSASAGCAFLVIGFLLLLAVRAGAPRVSAVVLFSPSPSLSHTPSSSSARTLQYLFVLAGKFLSAPIMESPLIPTIRTALVCTTLFSLCLGTIIGGAPGGIDMYRAVSVSGAKSAGGFGCAVSACVFQVVLVALHFFYQAPPAAAAFTAAAAASSTEEGV